MTITEYFSSLADNPYFGAGSGIFALGNFIIFNIFKLMGIYYST